MSKLFARRCALVKDHVSFLSIAGRHSAPAGDHLGGRGGSVSFSRYNFKNGRECSMQTEIVRMIDDFEHGRLSRRQLIAHLTGVIAASLGATVPFADQQAQPAAPPGRPPLPVSSRTRLRDASAAGGPGLDFDHDFAAEFLAAATASSAERRLTGILNFPGEFLSLIFVQSSHGWELFPRPTNPAWCHVSPSPTLNTDRKTLMTYRRSGAASDFENLV